MNRGTVFHEPMKANVFQTRLWTSAIGVSRKHSEKHRD